MLTNIIQSLELNANIFDSNRKNCADQHQSIGTVSTFNLLIFLRLQRPVDLFDEQPVHQQDMQCQPIQL